MAFKLLFVLALVAIGVNAVSQERLARVVSNDKNCVGKWSAWSSCSDSCGGGSQTRTWSVTTPATGSGTCSAKDGETSSKSCNTDPCPIDCVADWCKDWSTCTKTCGGGTQFKTWAIQHSARFGGKCEHDDGDKMFQDCNTQDCPEPCVSEWSEWSECDETCGGGVQYRTFKVITPAEHGGSCHCRDDCTSCTCKTGDRVSRECNSEKCPNCKPFRCHAKDDIWVFSKDNARNPIQRFGDPRTGDHTFLQLPGLKVTMHLVNSPVGSGSVLDAVKYNFDGPHGAVSGVVDMNSKLPVIIELPANNDAGYSGGRLLIRKDELKADDDIKVLGVYVKLDRETCTTVLSGDGACFASDYNEYDF